MQFFRKKAKSTGRVGLVIKSDHVALAHVEIRDGEPFLLHCERMAMQSQKEAPAVLAKMVKEFELEGEQCSFVLNPKDYNLHLVEAPSVEPGELRAAVRWKIKDLLDMKVEDAAVDVFQLPEDAYRGRDMVYVIAAMKSRIKSIVDMVNGSGLELAVIDIPELAMKNLSTRFIEDEGGVAFMDLRRTGSTMNITCNGDLYLTRRINSQLDPDVMQSAEWSTVKDRLVLEIQRSLDYYESQMGRNRITRVVIAQRQKDTGGMAETLNELLAADVSSLNLATEMESEVELTPETQQICMAAIGTTLRGIRKPEKSESSEQEAA